MEIASCLRIRMLPLLMGCGATLVLPQVGLAQEVAQETATLEEVIVTAERRSEDIQKTAASVAVRTGGELQAEGKYSLASILEDIPGVSGGAATSVSASVSSGTDTLARGLTIRGIPSNSGAGANITSVPSAAAIYVDGVYEGVGGGYDIDRVELLRGPQGTLYGRSATSGLVAIHTRDPKLGEYNGYAGAEFGNFRMRHYDGAANVPLGDKWALRVAANQYQRNGLLVDQEVSATDNKDARIKLLYQATDDLSLLFGVAVQNNKTYSGGINIYLDGPEGPFRYVPALSGTGENKYRQYWAELNWNLGFAQLTFQPALRRWNSTAIIPQRSATLTIDQVASTPKDDFWTHEVRLASNPDSTLAWQVGALYYDNDLSNHNRIVRYPSGALNSNSDINRRTTALGTFVEATYPIADTWRVTGGLRYDSTKVKVDQVYTTNTNLPPAPPANALSPTYGFPEQLSTAILSGEAGKRSYYNLTYKLRFEHDLTEQNLLYVLASSGVSPGDVALTRNSAGQPQVKEVDSESLKAYELGTKNRFLDNRLQLNGDVYYYDYGGFQTVSINTNTVPTPALFETLVSPVKSYGAELEILYQLTPNDRISFDASYTISRFEDKDRPVPGTNRTFGFYYGRDEVPGVVPFTATLGYNRTFNPFAGSKLVFQGDVRYRSSYYASRMLASQVQNAAQAALLTPYVHTSPEVVSNFSVTWSVADGRYSFTGWVRNVGDNQYKTSADVTNFASTGLTSIGTLPYDPRTYGLGMHVSW